MADCKQSQPATVKNYKSFVKPPKVPLPALLVSEEDTGLKEIDLFESRLSTKAQTAKATKFNFQFH